MSNSLVNKLVKIFSWGIMGVSVILALVFFFRISNAEPDNQIFVAESYILWAFILLVIAALLSVVFPLVNFIKNPRNTLKVVLSLVFMGLLFLVAFLMSDTTPLVTATSATEPNFSTPSVLRFADTGIFATYLLFGIAVLSLLFTGVRGIFKR
jgi:hypothetical protein